MLPVRGVYEVPVTIPTPISSITSIAALLCSLLIDPSVTSSGTTTEVKFELVAVTGMVVVCGGAGGFVVATTAPGALEDDSS